jgi:hypothetical protein
VVAFIVKGAWAAGRMGKLMLPDYKRALVQDVAFYELLDTLFALLANGTRSQGSYPRATSLGYSALPGGGGG